MRVTGSFQFKENSLLDVLRTRCWDIAVVFIIRYEI